MKSAKPGKNISDVEVTNVSKHGFWLLIGAKERFVPFGHFPWFRDAPISHLLNVELPHPRHLRWPDLDVDLAVESIDHPERFPLVSRKAGGGKTGVVSSTAGQSPRGRVTSL
ncbi:MAG: DUF2442 domain-containing protein [Betaproteobacteria bacterium]